MVRQMVFCVSLLMAVNCLGQTTNKARQGYEQFKKQARQGYSVGLAMMIMLLS